MDVIQVTLLNAQARPVAKIIKTLAEQMAAAPVLHDGRVYIKISVDGPQRDEWVESMVGVAEQILAESPAGGRDSGVQS